MIFFKIHVDNPWVRHNENFDSHDYLCREDRILHAKYCYVSSHYV